MANSMPIGIKRALAQKALEAWRPPPGLAYVARQKWRRWALCQAMDMVYRGQITGTAGWVDGRYTATAYSIPSWSPSTPPEFLSELQAEPPSAYEAQS